MRILLILLTIFTTNSFADVVCEHGSKYRFLDDVATIDIERNNGGFWYFIYVPEQIEKKPFMDISIYSGSLDNLEELNFLYTLKEHRLNSQIMASFYSKVSAENYSVVAIYGNECTWFEVRQSLAPNK